MAYKLVWKDDFSVDGKPNKEIWTNEVAGHGYGNNEEQFYTDRLKNSYVENGVLNIVAYKEEYEGKKYTSARLMTYGKKSMKYGKIAITAKLPKGLGSWPAIWMLPNIIHEGVNWPRCGEIDIMEHIGRELNSIHFSLHSEKLNHNLKTQPTHIIKLETATTDFNRYEIEWDETKIAYFVNGVHYKTFEKKATDTFAQWPFDQEFYLILNLAVGGGWPGKVDESIFPIKMQVSAVEVYEKE